MEINQAFPIAQINGKQAVRVWDIQAAVTGKKEKVKSAMVISLAAVLLKTYMTMSHLWLMADKIKKAANTVSVPKTVSVKTSRAA